MEADRASCSDDLLEGLRAEGIGRCDGFLTAGQLQELGRCADVRRDRGDFRQARIGGGHALKRRPDIRGDSICWLEEPLFPAEREYLAMLEVLRLSFNQVLFLGLYDLEQHYARYPAGAGYVRHVDQPRGGGLRRLSAIVYLNENWRESDGGILRCRSDCGEFRNIEPVGGRLVLFLSEGREHEVVPATRERLSIAGWFLGRPEQPLR